MQTERDWWNLPGPSGFANAVVEALRNRRNVVLALPEHHPPALEDCLAEQIRVAELAHVLRLDLGDESPTLSPARLIHDRFSSLTTGEPAKARTVVIAPELQQTVVWVENQTNATWQQWSCFLRDYSRECRAHSDAEPPLFVVPVVGQLVEQLPDSDVHLQVERAEGRCQRFDMLIHVAELWASVPSRSSLHRELAVSILVELAGTDPRVAWRFQEQPEAIFNPLPILQEIGVRRGWKGTSQTSHAVSKQTGRVDMRDGRPFVHSADLAHRDASEIQQRLWRGQVAVLFPFLEDCRRRFIDAHHIHLQVPVQTDYECITNKSGLELNHLAYQLRHRVDHQTWIRIELCREMRNDLAHLKPIAGTVLLSPDFQYLADCH